MNDIQKMFDAFSAAAKQTRSSYHVTLGDAIEALSKVPAGMVVVAAYDDDKVGVSEPHSYRGYYSDLALKPSKFGTAGELLSALRSALGKTFQGYKGGDYVMDNDTPLWLSSYGKSSGLAIMDVILPPADDFDDADAEVVLVAKLVD